MGFGSKQTPDPRGHMTDMRDEATQTLGASCREGLRTSLLRWKWNIRDHSRHSVMKPSSAPLSPLLDQVTNLCSFTSHTLSDVNKHARLSSGFCNKNCWAAYTTETNAHSSGGWKSKTEGLADWVPLPGLQTVGPHREKREL